MQERRAEPRLLCSDLIHAQIDGQEFMVNLEDISPSGACIQLEERVTAGARITLKLGDHHFAGTVQYCIWQEIGYFSGIRFDADCRWSESLYRPKHLLDPAKLRAG